MPVRLNLGAVLLAAGRARTRPRRSTGMTCASNPGTGWALFGLLQALKAQGKNADARSSSSGCARPGRIPTSSSPRHESAHENSRIPTVFMISLHSMSYSHDHMDLEVRHLRLIAGIAEAGSMTKAAMGLHLTQSALSHQLRDIESRFNTPVLPAGRQADGPDGGRPARARERRRASSTTSARVEEDIRQLAATPRRRDSRRHPVQHRLSLAAAAARAVQPQASSRHRQHHGGRDRPARRRRSSTAQLDLAILTNDVVGSEAAPPSPVHRRDGRARLAPASLGVKALGLTAPACDRAPAALLELAGRELRAPPCPGAGRRLPRHASPSSC